MNQGPLAREPCINVMVDLTDCKLHEDAIHRGPGQIYPAVREGVKDAMRQAGALLYEPIQVIQLEAPEEFIGELSKLIANKRGQLLEMEQKEGQTIVKGKIPVAEMFGITSDLRSSTEGRGNYFVVDQTFEKLPSELQEKTIANIRNRKGLTENQ